MTVVVYKPSITMTPSVTMKFQITDKSGLYKVLLEILQKNTVVWVEDPVILIPVLIVIPITILLSDAMCYIPIVTLYVWETNIIFLEEMALSSVWGIQTLARIPPVSSVTKYPTNCSVATNSIHPAEIIVIEGMAPRCHSSTFKVDTG